MAKLVVPHVVEASAPVDIPERREYDTEAEADLDRRLCDAIEAADAAGHAFLRRLLAIELGSLYYETR